MAYRGYPLAVDLARVVTRYPLVMSDPSDLPPDSARQQTAATGFEIPVPTRGRFGANLDRICRGDDGGGDGAGDHRVGERPSDQA